MKKTLLVLLVLLSLCTLLVSCSGEKLVGTWGGIWEGTDIEISFEKDGVCGYKMDGRSYIGTWKTEDGKLTVKIDNAGQEHTFIDNASYVAGDSSLTIEVGGKTVQLTKKQ